MPSLTITVVENRLGVAVASKQQAKLTIAHFTPIYTQLRLSDAISQELDNIIKIDATGKFIVHKQDAQTQWQSTNW